MLPSVAAPSFGAYGESFPNFVLEARLWRREANLEVTKRASAFVLQTESTARDVCMALCGYRLMAPGVAGEVPQVLHYRFAPDAPDMVYHDVARFLPFKRADQ